MRQCEDAEGCPAPADFTYVWPGTKQEYAGCTRHAYKAAAVVGNMGQQLELVPIGGGPAVTIGGPAPATPGPGTPVPDAPARASKEQIDELEGELDDARKRIRALEDNGETMRREYRGLTDELNRRLIALEKKPAAPPPFVPGGAPQT